MGTSKVVTHVSAWGGVGRHAGDEGGHLCVVQGVRPIRGWWGLSS